MSKIMSGKTEEILKIARGKFRKKGYSHTGISEIASAAGLSQHGLKKYFSSKRALFEALYGRERRAVRKKLENLISKTDCTHRTEVVKTLNALFQYIQKSVFLNMIYTFGDFPLWYCLRDAGETDNDPFSGQSSLLERFLTECQKTGIVRSESPAHLTQAFRDLIHLVLQNRSQDSESVRLDAFVVEIFIDGLITVP